ncbi:hypothetical protein [Bradyrhizobium diazoefficiens]|uniref:hypothetical protein n=1 Tax=Bradyrhizobium diazoefficiens TaxID=1355477 RepID=UPI0027150933|nr:hypothetical protein [Bradyrhizobium diazoefficiens]WLC16655.1 hypothetical protein QIH76_42480 [Bradyrhizobium diazoefficiens]
MRLQIERAKRLSFPVASDVPARWLAYIERKLATVEMKLDSLRDLPADARADLQAEGLLTRILACEEDLEVLDQADTGQVADFVVTPLLRWFKTADPSSEYLFASDTLFEVSQLFEVENQAAEDVDPKFRSVADRLGKLVYRVRMPGGALGTALHIPLVAHEIGHVLMFAHPEDFDNKIDILFDGLEEKWKDTFYNWVVEIVADTVCGFVAGPAAFFALHEKLRGNKVPDERYPQNYVRTSSLGSFVHATYGTVFSQMQLTESDWKAWAIRSEDALLTEIEEHEEYIDLSRRLVRALPIIRDIAVEFARTHAKDLEYPPSRYSADLDVHLESFIHAIPPFETDGDLQARKPTELASILNVGWFIAAFRLEQLRIRASAGVDKSGMLLIALDQLILKAIELSEIRRQWEGKG